MLLECPEVEWSEWSGVSGVGVEIHGYDTVAVKSQFPSQSDAKTVSGCAEKLKVFKNQNWWCSKVAASW